MKQVKATIPIFDPFVSWSLEQIPIFKSLIKQHLPKSLQKLLDLKTLRSDERPYVLSVKIGYGLR